jgi:amino acid transporter
MDRGVVLILTVFVAGYVGVFLMAAAFVIVARRGGWRQAIRSEPDGRWRLPRRLMFAVALSGAAFGFAVVMLFLIPGGIPWSTGSDWATGVAAVLPAVAAVWYFIIRPGFAHRRHETAGPAASRENSRGK